MKSLKMPQRPEEDTKLDEVEVEVLFLVTLCFDGK